MFLNGLEQMNHILL